jgi:hypothetical protein
MGIEKATEILYILQNKVSPRILSQLICEGNVEQQPIYVGTKLNMKELLIFQAPVV